MARTRSDLQRDLAHPRPAGHRLPDPQCRGALRAVQAKGYRTTTREASDANAAAGILAVGGVYDPNGNVIELIELAPGLVTSRLQEVHGTDE